MHDNNPYSSPGIERAAVPSPATHDAHRVTVQLTLDDLVSFNVLHAKLSSKRRLLHYLRWLFLPALLFFLGLLLFRGNFPAMRGVAISLWSVAALFLAVFPGSRKRTLRQVLAKASAANEHMALQEVTMTLLPEGIFRSSAAEDVLRRWHAIKKVVQTPDMFVIYIAPAVAYLAPRRFFASDAHFQEFQRLTLDYLQQAGRER